MSVVGCYCTFRGQIRSGHILLKYVGRMDMDKSQGALDCCRASHPFNLRINRSAHICRVLLITRIGPLLIFQKKKQLVG